MAIAATVAKGSIECILRAIDAHGSSVGVQGAGSWALWSLGANSGAQVAIAAKGGIEAAVRAMGAPESSAGVQERGCWALEIMARWDSGLRSQVREAGAAPLMERVLFAFPDNAEIQKHGKSLLVQLRTR